MIKTIATDSIDDWLERLRSGAKVFVPQQRQGGDVVLEPMGRASRVADYIRLAESPKRILLPQVDDLVCFEEGRGRAQLDRTERILFGLRPCDAAAVMILDEFFSRDYADPNYLARRQHMKLIVVACRESQESCFCVSAGTGPVAGEGFDVQLFDFGEVHLAEAGTEAGENLMARGGDLLTDPPEDAREKIEQFRRKSRDAQKLTLDLDRIREIIRNHAEPADFWEKVAQRCFMCGGCAYLCPTCTCYNIVDRPEAPGRGVRRRLWDTCVLGGFTREASGHNPREELSLRCAHRYLHKLGSSNPPLGAIRCVGCGRCADVCITRMGLIRVAEELLEQVD